MEDLDHGDIDDICRAARAYRLDSIKKYEIETALGYFENNVPACALTGSVPAARSSDPEPSRQAASPSSGQRLKLSGMHWTVAGAPSPLPAALKTGSITQTRTRHQPPEQPNPLTILVAYKT
jgi:hypothetical protein